MVAEASVKDLRSHQGRNVTLLVTFLIVCIVATVLLNRGERLREYVSPALDSAGTNVSFECPTDWVTSVQSSSADAAWQVTGPRRGFLALAKRDSLAWCPEWLRKILGRKSGYKEVWVTIYPSKPDASEYANMHASFFGARITGAYYCISRDIASGDGKHRVTIGIETLSQDALDRDALRIYESFKVTGG